MQINKGGNMRISDDETLRWDHGNQYGKQYAQDFLKKQIDKHNLLNYLEVLKYLREKN